jgi:hypothetical protein
VKSRLDVDILRGKQGFHFGAVFLHDHQPQTAIVLDIPGPGNQFKAHPVLLEDRFGVHSFMRGMEQQDKMLIR